jgi:hypothetical protein
VLLGGGAAAGVHEPSGGVSKVETGGEGLAGGVVPQCLDVELDSGRGGQVRDAAARPVWIPRPGIRRLVGRTDRRTA